MSRLFYKVRRIPKWVLRSILKIVKIYQYVPILWADEDWDCHFIVVLLRYKLSRTRTCILKNDILLESAQHEIERQILLVEKLLRRVENDDYRDWLERNISKKYGENYRAYMGPKDSVFYKLFIEEPPNDYDTRYTEAERADMRKMRIDAGVASMKMKSRDISRALRIMAKYLENWWD